MDASKRQKTDFTTTQSNHIKMHSHPDDAACNRRIGLSNHEQCEQHERVFRLFDFASEPTSTKAENNDSPLKSIRGAASAVFGGIWSALDSAIAILNEDMNMEDSAAETVGPNDDGNDGESSMCMMSESAESCSEEDTNTLKISPTVVANPSKVTDNCTAVSESLSVAKKTVLSNTLDVGTPTPIEAKLSLSMMGKCLAGSRFFADPFKQNNVSFMNDDNVHSDYCVVNNESCRGETSDGWLVVSDE